MTSTGCLSHYEYLSCRSSLEQLLKENHLTPGGEENLKCFFREEGYQTGISNVLKVLPTICVP